MPYRKRQKQRERPEGMLHNGKYKLTKVKTDKRINSIPQRKKFKRTANFGYCMVTAVNNVLGDKILDTKEVVESADQENASNRKHHESTFGTKNGYFHFHTIQMSLYKKGYLFEDVKDIKHTHKTLSEIDSGRYVVLGWSDAINVHAIAIDGKNKLCICDTERGFWPLSKYSILKSLPFGVFRCFRVSKRKNIK
jgi:hypothetical protein